MTVERIDTIVRSTKTTREIDMLGALRRVPVPIARAVVRDD